MGSREKHPPHPCHPRVTGQLGSQRTEPKGLWGRPTPSPLSLPPPSLHTPTRAGVVGGRSGVPILHPPLCL